MYFIHFWRVQQLNWEPRLPNIGYNKLIILVVARLGASRASGRRAPRDVAPLLLPVRQPRPVSSCPSYCRFVPDELTARARRTNGSCPTAIFPILAFKKWWYYDYTYLHIDFANHLILLYDDRGKWEKEIMEKIDGVSYCNVDIIKKSFETWGLISQSIKMG